MANYHDIQPVAEFYSEKSIFDVMLQCLLHDIGKVLYRAGEGSGNHSIRGSEYLKKYISTVPLSGIRYHHRSELNNANIPADDTAYIVYLADNISSGSDRRKSEDTDDHTGFNRFLPLESIFNRIGNRVQDKAYCADHASDALQYPASASKNDAISYQHILARISDGLAGISLTPEYANSLIGLLRHNFGYIPASTAIDERCDISLYHHSKTTAAIGCCIKSYLDAKGETDYRSLLFASESEQRFMQTPVFVLFSVDLSGIQHFIYTISRKGALKGLRARSFYLSMLMEHIADRILEECGLFRTNLIYSGGGKAHLLLPNVPELLAKAKAVIESANRFLRDRFGAALFLATGECICTGNELTSNSGKDDGFVKLFREASAQISKRKISRYSAKELLALNAFDAENHDRECIVCGSAGKLIKRGEDDLCETCYSMEKFAAAFTGTDQVLIVENTASQDALPLPEGMYLRAVSEKDARKKLESSAADVIRLYGINKSYTGLKMTTSLSVGNYSSLDEQGARMTFEELASCSEGIKRLGVLRADVDNLGALFANGLYVKDIQNPWKYATLSRYTALSAAITDFFQGDINRIVKGNNPSPRNVSIVYAGGDDVFLVGAWNEIIDAAVDLQNEFARYTGNAVTISAGIGLFKEMTPVGIMAESTADLENDAKQHPDKSKNAVSLFETKHHCYHWDVLKKEILGTHYALLHSVLKGDDDNGNAFLYHVLELLRTINSTPMAIARLAYTLARHAPENGAGIAVKEAYTEFSKKVYAWAMNPEDNKKLQTAILYYVYKNRREQ